MSPEEPFTGPYLLLCEGASDVSFMYELFRQRSLPPNRFDIYAPVSSKDGRGRSAFGKFLRLRYVDEEFIENIRAVLIVSDSDDDKSFGEVQGELAKAGFPVPEAAEMVATADEYPAVVVYMLPHDRHGNLEELCLPAAYNKWDYIKAPLDAFVNALPVKDWILGKQAKMRLQTTLSAINDSQPDCGFGAMWHQAEKYQVPLQAPEFENLAEFIREFPNLVGV